MPLDAHFAIGNFIHDGLKGGPIHVNGDGTPYRSYLYAADLMVWLWTILAKGQSCRPYNVGSDQAICIRELAEKVKEVLVPEVEVHIKQRAIPGVEAQRYMPCVERARSALGLSVWTLLEPSLGKTFVWARSNFHGE